MPDRGGLTWAIFAGGPSLTQAQVDACRGLRTIAINNAYQLAPWADVLYACDWRWWSWHPDAMSFAGRKYVMATDAAQANGGHYQDLIAAGVEVVSNAGAEGLSLESGALSTGRNSGYQAINLAVQLGAKRVLLLGYDMRRIDGRTHWHPPHQVANDPKVYANTYLPPFKKLPLLLARLGVEVLNCTPGSALDVFPRADLQEALCETSTP